jgi:hypothetical protein
MYAAYSEVFIALALAWGVVVDGSRPERWDLLGAALCVVGVLVMVALPGGSRSGAYPQLRLQDALGPPSALTLSHDGPSPPTEIPNPKNGQHSRSLATNSAAIARAPASSG